MRACIYEQRPLWNYYIVYVHVFYVIVLNVLNSMVDEVLKNLTTFYPKSFHLTTSVKHFGGVLYRYIKYIYVRNVDETQTIIVNHMRAQCVIVHRII